MYLTRAEGRRRPVRRQAPVALPAVLDYHPRKAMRFAALALLLLAVDHTPCFKDATIGYGVGSEKAGA